MEFENYTERSRGFVQAAQVLALGRGHQRFVPEHLLAVLLDDKEGLAANLMHSAGARPDEARAGVGAALGKLPQVGGSGAGSAPSRRAKRSELGIAEESEVVVAIGMVKERKGSAVLTRAWTRVVAERPNSLLLFVGPLGEEKVMAEVRSALSPEARARVRFVGEVPDVRAYLAVSDLYVLASDKEGMGNAVMEAMASGVPCLLTPYVGLPEEFGRPGTTFASAPREPHEFGQAIVDLLSDPSQRRSLAANAKRNVRDHLSIRQAVQAYADLYLELSARSSRRK